MLLITERCLRLKGTRKVGVYPCGPDGTPDRSGVRMPDEMPATLLMQPYS
jgi:hypothetical protein